MISKDSGSEIVPDFSKDAFVGTAQYYSRYRPPYPQELLNDLCLKAGISGKGRLLDLGCGPGRVALALNQYFDEIWAVDPEVEMIDEGRRVSGEIRNLRWMIARAEDLNAPNEFFDLITIGEAFHRFNQRLVASRAFRWLKPGCCLAILWQINLWRGDQEWQRLVREVVNKYTRSPLDEGHITREKQYPSFEDALRANGFESIATREFSAPYVWTLSSMIGYLYSTSMLSKRILGNRCSHFEKDLKKTLTGCSSDGQFAESVGFGYLIGSRSKP